MHQENRELLRGAIAAVVYQNKENGYTVLRLQCEDGRQVTVVGTIPMAAVGERLTITGHWCSHPSYGRQFAAEYLEQLMPESQSEILAYLSSRTIRGIGAKTAQRIVDRFGDASLDILENHPEQLTQIPGISAKKAQEINASFCRQTGMRRLIELFSAYRLPVELAVRVYKVYGPLSAEMVAEDPYLLTAEDLGADFSLVDAFALETGMQGDDPRRIEAGILFTLTHNLGNGHTFLPGDKLTAATATLLSLPEELVASALERLSARGQIQTDEIAGISAVYLPLYYEAETYLTHRLGKMAQAELPLSQDAAGLCRQVEGQTDLHYAPEQRQAIEKAAAAQLFILTGGPGTGKTTTLAGILALFDLLKLKLLLAAPTGRAAKRLSDLTCREAATIHRLLGAEISPESGQMGFTHNESNPLKCDGVIVDEASMVDLPLMYSLVQAMPEGCRLILVGDPDQLPSVGPGNVFSDLIRSKQFATVRLTKIFRQAQESLIVMNAHAVNQGQLPVLSAKDRDFFFLQRPTGLAVQQTITQLCSQRLPQNMGISPQDIQVLSPTRKGESGSQQLNAALQEALNPPSPGKREKKRGGFFFREGDRVMQIRNNYDILWKKDGVTGAGLYNGDIGVIHSIDPQRELMSIGFDERMVDYSFDDLGDLELAYAMTVHKSQGSEYPAVILAVHRGSPLLLTRSILYTAITRARSLLILVGEPQVVAEMVENNRRTRRYSGLKWRLQEALCN